MRSTTMARRYVLREPISHLYLQRLLSESGLSLHEFARSTGADIRRVHRWLSGEQADPPLWAVTFLLAVRSPDARDRVWEYVGQNTINTETEERSNG